MNWTLEDYRDFYNERAGIESEIFATTENRAEMSAYNATLNLFKEQEVPTDNEIREFHIFMKKNKRKC